MANNTAAVDAAISLACKSEEEALDALLDDALNDFDKPQQKSTETELRPNQQFIQKNVPTKQESGSTEMPSSKNPNEKSEASIEANVSAALRDLSVNMKHMTNIVAGEGGDSMPEELLRAMEQMSASGPADMDAFQQEFIKSMQGFPEDGSNEGADGFLGAMQGMMDNLLSKELLYPSLIEIKTKYPTWLRENPTHSYIDRYREQSRIVEQLCDQFESEREDDSEQVKRKRTNCVIDLMQQMQQIGHPPEDMMEGVVGDPFQTKSDSATQEECTIITSECLLFTSTASKPIERYTDDNFF